jgi:hypothetical protein
MAAEEIRRPLFLSVTRRRQTHLACRDSPVGWVQKTLAARLNFLGGKKKLAAER